MERHTCLKLELTLTITHMGNLELPIGLNMQFKMQLPRKTYTETTKNMHIH